MKTTPQFLLALVALLFAHPGAAQPTSGTSAKSTQSAKEEGGKSTLRRSSRMEFDGRLVKGERAAGAVYLFQRAPRRLPPLLRLKRTNWIASSCRSSGRPTQQHRGIV